MDILKVRDAADVEQAVRATISREQPIEIIGHGSKRAVGRPVETNAVLDLSSLSAVVDYEPSELILTVQAGAPMADVLSLIDARNQEFAFEPMNMAPLLGGSDMGTIGGMVAAGLAGPRRIKQGGARDHLLGAMAVSGFGETFKAGGKVVKNVTGYDLCKLLAGSWGTLAVMTEVTLKVMPRAESQCTILLRGLDDVTAVRALVAATGSPFDISGVAHAPAAIAGDLHAILNAPQDEQALTLVRLEGISSSVAHRAGSVTALLKEFGAAEVIAEDQSDVLWAAIRDVTPFALGGAFGARDVWRVACPPASGGRLGEALAQAFRADILYDWGGGLLWVAPPSPATEIASALRSTVARHDGYATLIRASEAVRRQVDVFPPQDAGLAALGARVRQSFDPKQILNRGRM